MMLAAAIYPLSDLPITTWRHHAGLPSFCSTPAQCAAHACLLMRELQWSVLGDAGRYLLRVASGAPASLAAAMKGSRPMGDFFSLANVSRPSQSFNLASAFICNPNSSHKALIASHC